MLIRKTRTVLFSVIIGSSLTACANLTGQESLNSPQWDFDHQVQFRQTELENNSFQLELIQNNKVDFKQLSALLLRRSYLICGSYGYKITVLKGVESVDYKRASPNLIRSNLVAKLECPPKAAQTD